MRRFCDYPYPSVFRTAVPGQPCLGMVILVRPTLNMKKCSRAPRPRWYGTGPPTPPAHTTAIFLLRPEVPIWRCHFNCTRGEATGRRWAGRITPQPPNKRTAVHQCSAPRRGASRRQMGCLGRRDLGPAGSQGWEGEQCTVLQARKWSLAVAEVRRGAPPEIPVVIVWVGGHTAR